MTNKQVLNTRITNGFTSEDNVELDIQVKGKADNDTELIVNAIEKLISTIDVKHACNEDDGLYEGYMERILLALTDNYGAAGWYDVYGDLDSTYYQEEDLDEFTVASKLKVLKDIIYQIEEKQSLKK
ncbi:hypothetical protein [Anaerobacillus sp. 1_MG-2023]|uniref:hypothetical protein n=1 Tax=Anaerobacillus sp. 1_MG-2023 TaxID=3062655 RepID=UPI0026E15BE0|nr:hypothetical protein [Anaerobacillus sp. 1_MG-2023]MDO6657508.1 hypothetical protein [Anaerobacillus sp. 1_MG-2023]